MIDRTREILLAKYSGKVNSSSTADIAISEIIKSERKAIGVVVMNSVDYDAGEICDMAAQFNTAFPNMRSNSFVLPATWNDIPKDSWVFVAYTDV